MSMCIMQLEVRVQEKIQKQFKWIKNDEVKEIVLSRQHCNRLIKL